MKRIGACALGIVTCMASFAQRKEAVKLVRDDANKKVDIYIGGQLFTRFLYPDTLEKPVLYPVIAADGAVVTRGYPLKPLAGDPTDHPHHIGIWFNYENVNGLDFWNNSFAIPASKKSQYGWIKTHTLVGTGNSSTSDGAQVGSLSYRANWTNQQGEVLLEENTTLEFSGSPSLRVIDRVTTLKAVTDVLFKDAKDGLLGMRIAHALQLPTRQDQKFTDDKGNVTIVKGGSDNIPTGNYLTSEGKEGDSAWSTRGSWCKLYGKMGADSIAIVMIDHPSNPNYPTYWHARGYGLFAANPLGEAIFSNGKRTKNLHLAKGESVVFRYRIVIDNGKRTIRPEQIEMLAGEFAKKH
ncbi:MAG TPA: PmoA family protein [Chitinophagaceae bacterium]